MTVQERKERARIKRRKQIIKRRIVLTMISVFVITMGCIVCGSIFTSAKNPETDIPQYKYYKSITIEQGDSLWSIAETYCCEEYKDTYDYIAEVKELNGLTSDTIHEGQHLVVAYYDTVFR